ncbi:conserved hypothetical protein [Hyphomonas neptunium ATCC 15444]|uniref:Uncharacterized protein n=2 Tax=Hyphomonas TaxID=85 RepID=Q0C1Q5_HYPNA|nr:MULTISPECIES: hypothetical protein [Hyphomonas]ABI78325.1 conserved hypothetical protein [Hyphomonas neptunium ATCC 15444]KCZ92578.1 hypothetical protein HHI_11381 [Hyphomonas hirschiana VP5]
MLRALIVVPLLIIPIILYLFVSMSAGEGGTALRLQANLFSIAMMSGGRWAFSLGDFILLIGLIFLFIEILKAARTKSDAIVNHSLSMVLLLFCVIGFLAIPGFGTSVFFLLMVMTLLDVVAGPIVSIVAARRDFGVGENIGG